MSQFKLQDAVQPNQLFKIHALDVITNVRPRSAPNLELLSRAVSSVGVMYRSSGPNTGSNPGGGRILKKVTKRRNSPIKNPKKKSFTEKIFKRDIYFSSILAHNKMTPPESSWVGSFEPRTESRVRVARSKMARNFTLKLGTNFRLSFSYKIWAKF